MGDAKPKPEELLAQLFNLPIDQKGEIIKGVLHTMPRPKAAHVFAGSSLGYNIGGPFGFDPKGPGGWVIVDEPLIEFPLDTWLVPDLAGWRKSRLPILPEGHVFDIIPDWVCEILSPSTAKRDLHDKLPIFEAAGVEFVWYVDPEDKSLSAYQRIDGRMTLITHLKGEADVCVPPFDAVSFPLVRLWG